MTYWKGRLRKQYLRNVQPSAQKPVSIIPSSISTVEIAQGGVTNNNIQNYSITSEKFTNTVNNIIMNPGFSPVFFESSRVRSEMPIRPGPGLVLL